MNIYGNSINIGDPNSIVNIIGTTNFIGTNDLILVDKLISLNLNASTGTGFDDGNSCGIQILGTNGTGFIQTNIDASRFQILTPGTITANYIATVDLNNNLYVTGMGIFNEDMTLLSNLNVSGNTVIYGKTTINSNLNIANNTILVGNITIQ